jgi:hypothetical protein
MMTSRSTSARGSLESPHNCNIGEVNVAAHDLAALRVEAGAKIQRSTRNGLRSSIYAKAWAQMAPLNIKCFLPQPPNPPLLECVPSW